MITAGRATPVTTPAPRSLWHVSPEARVVEHNRVTRADGSGAAAMVVRAMTSVLFVCLNQDSS